MGTNPSVDQRRVHGDLVFATNRDRCSYIGTSISDLPRWLKEHAGSWRRIEDVQREAAALAPPAEREIKVGATPVGQDDQTSSRGVQNDGDDEDNTALVDTLAGDCSPPRQPASPPTPLTVPVANETTEVELPNRAEVGVSGAKGPKIETTPLKAMRRKPSRSGGRKLKKQKLPAEVSKAGRKLSPERMRIVLDSLRECPILRHAARKAGIHRKTLEYWIKRSEAGDDGYDIEWRGEIWRFHEHCESAIQEAYDKLDEVLYHLAMGGVVYKYDEFLLSLDYEGPDAYLRDENGDPVVETIRKPNGKMMRFYLVWKRPEKWSKHPKIDVPHHSGVLVVGATTKKPENTTATAASIKVRKWKSLSRMIAKAKP